MKIAKREDFALIFMKTLIDFYPHKYVSLTTVAKKVNLSPLFLKHIASSLLEKDLIESREGIRGGYRLKRNPKDIKVSEIIEAISKGLITPSCVHGGTCRVKKASCSCISLWYNVNKGVFQYLRKISLSDFAKL